MTPCGAQDHAGVSCGDFGGSNILIHDRLSGVIDWEADDDGLPVLDAFNYLDATYRQCVPGLSITDTVPLLVEGRARPLRVSSTS